MACRRPFVIALLHCAVPVTKAHVVAALSTILVGTRSSGLRPSWTHAYRVASVPETSQRGVGRYGGRGAETALRVVRGGAVARGRGDRSVGGGYVGLDGVQFAEWYGEVDAGPAPGWSHQSGDADRVDQGRDAEWLSRSGQGRERCQVAEVHAPSNCTALIDKAGGNVTTAATGPLRICWNTKRTSTVALRMAFGSVPKQPALASLTGNVTAGLFKGQKVSGTVQWSLGSTECSVEHR